MPSLIIRDTEFMSDAQQRWVPDSYEITFSDIKFGHVLGEGAYGTVMVATIDGKGEHAVKMLKCELNIITGVE